tara:strand:+ start:495 stop:1766 length:1272 start_codon:yes stop_codon:yes gene_type:complete
MATSLLPKATIGVKKTTINSAVLRELKPEKSTGSTQSTGIERIGPKDSFIEKLTGIRNFHLKRYESNLFTFAEERKRLQEERIREREEKIEKPSKKRIISIGAPAPAKSIFDSIGNFLLFTAGGILFNRFADLEKSFGAIQKTLEGIGKGIEIVADIAGNFTNFIDSAVKGYDDFLQKIEDVSGFDKKKIEKFMEDFKYVINGAVIAAILTVRALPLFVSRYLRNRLRKTPLKTPTSTTTNIPKSGQFGGGAKTGIDLAKGTRTIGGKVVSAKSASRYTASVTRFISGKANAGDMLRLLRRGFFKPLARFATPIFERIPIIGGIIDFLVNFFLFKEPLGKSLFLSAGSTLGGFIGGLLGAVAGPPGVAAGAVLGGIGGDWAARGLYDVIFGDDSLQQISGIDEYADYDLMTETNNIFIQPVET